MHTELSEEYSATAEGKIAADVIAKCVHCGFCNATCPTYQLLGDELDGPRGRIYQLKQVFEGAPATPEIALHLDRCLTCLNCESTCPSGVAYHKLLNVGRKITDQAASRSFFERFQRWVLKTLLARRELVTPTMRVAQTFRGLMPTPLKQVIPAKQAVGDRPVTNHARKMLLLEGCVQPGMKPLTNAACIRVLDKLGITVVTASNERCCGALSFHLNDQARAKTLIKQNIDAWWPYVEQGIEAIISTASGCGAMVKNYVDLIGDDSAYAAKAARVALLTQDVSQILIAEDLDRLQIKADKKVAFHAPCTLQHGQKITNVVETILKQCGYELTGIPDSHLCCGSAGTYSIFQKQLSGQLLANKLKSIGRGQPDLIATANIGCQLHLESAADQPVVHWIELLDPITNPSHRSPIP